MDFANPRTNVAERIARRENARIIVHTLADRYIVMTRLIDAGYSDVHSALQDPGTRPGWSYRASWEITGTAPREDDAREMPAPAILAELSTGDDDADPSGECAEFSIEDVRAHIAGSAILGAPAPAQDARSSQRIEWENTRRGLIGLAEIRTPRPSGSDLVSVVWFAESGESGREDGTDARARAVAMAYVALCAGRI